MTREELPEAFVALHANGRLVTRFRLGDWADRLEILSWHTVEWTRSVDDVLAFEPADEWPRAFVPFATGDAYPLGGDTLSEDLFGWDLSGREHGELPVVLVRADEQTTERWATDFSAFLLRHLVLLVTTWDARLDGDLRARNAVWDAHRAIVAPHLGPRDRERLERLGPRPTPAHCERMECELANHAVYGKASP